MKVNVRLSVGLAQIVGNPRLTVSLPDNATVAELLVALGEDYPQLYPKLNTAVAVIAGRHTPVTTGLAAGQEVALLLPIAGGC
jgi:molybdopterin converting factor small subunit